MTSIQGVSLFQHSASGPRYAQVLPPDRRWLVIAVRERLHTHFDGREWAFCTIDAARLR